MKSFNILHTLLYIKGRFLSFFSEKLINWNTVIYNISTFNLCTTKQRIAKILFCKFIYVLLACPIKFFSSYRHLKHILFTSQIIVANQALPLVLNLKALTQSLNTFRTKIAYKMLIWYSGHIHHK